MIVWRIGAKIIITVLCRVVYYNSAQEYAETCEQFLELSVGFRFGFSSCVFV